MFLHERLCPVTLARFRATARPLPHTHTYTLTLTLTRQSSIASPPFQRRLQPGADDLTWNEPSWGHGLCMALQRPGLIRHGRCRSRACDLREPLIIHAAATRYLS
jgi:hypothetical protein